MGIRPRIPKAGMFLDNSDGEARWYTIEIANLATLGVSPRNKTPIICLQQSHISPLQKIVE